MNPRNAGNVKAEEAGARGRMREYQIAHIAKAPAIANGTLDAVPALERSSLCALAGAGGGGCTVFAGGLAGRTAFKGRRGSAWCHSGWTGSSSAECPRFLERAAFPS